MIIDKLKIVEPITEQDFKGALELIQKNVLRDKNWGLDYFKNLALGEIFVAKYENQVIGVATQRMPGKIFEELGDEYFDIDHIKVDRKEYGFIVLVAIDKKYQGQGIGKKLLEEAMKRQRDWSAKAVGVHCWQGSPGHASEKLFSSFGFIPLKMHKAPWKDYSAKLTLEEFECPICGIPCVCDELEMIKYL